MKPDSRIDGRKKNIPICIAWRWFWAMVEKVLPNSLAEKAGLKVRHPLALAHREIDPEQHPSGAIAGGQIRNRQHAAPK